MNLDKLQLNNSYQYGGRKKLHIPFRTWTVTDSSSPTRVLSSLPKDLKTPPKEVSKKRVIDLQAAKIGIDEGLRQLSKLTDPFFGAPKALVHLLPRSAEDNVKSYSPSYISATTDADRDRQARYIREKEYYENIPSGKVANYFHKKLDRSREGAYSNPLNLITDIPLHLGHNVASSANRFSKAIKGTEFENRGYNVAAGIGNAALAGLDALVVSDLGRAAASKLLKPTLNNLPKSRTSVRDVEEIPSEPSSTFSDLFKEDFSTNVASTKNADDLITFPEVLEIPESLTTSFRSKSIPRMSYTEERFPINSNSEARKKLMDKYKSEFEAKFGKVYDEKDLGLYAKLQEPNNLERVFTRRRRNIASIDKTFIDKHGIRTKYTPEEEILMDSYTQGYDFRINHPQFVGNEKLGDYYRHDVGDKLENLITSNKLKEPEVFRRYINDYTVKQAWRNGKPLPKGTQFSELRVGDEWQPNAFTSTGLPQTSYTSPSIFSEIHAPKGQSILFPNASGVKNYQGELEAVLPRKLRFRVEEKNSNNYFNSWEDVPEGYISKNGLSKVDGKLHYNGEEYLDPSLSFNSEAYNYAIEKFLRENRRPNFKHSIVNPYVLTPGIGLGALYLNANRKNNNEFR